MADDFGPIQVVLEPRGFQEERVRQPGGRPKEFFEGNDAGFVAHRRKIQQSLLSVGQTLQSSSASKVGFLRVRMRDSALAKSHRPTQHLFPAVHMPAVGSRGMGELIIQVTPRGIAHALDQSSRAEDTLEYRPKKNKPDELEPNPSRQRSEVGAIDSVALWSPADRRQFDATQAISWFGTRAVPRAYRIDLFDKRRPENRSAAHEYDKAGDAVADLHAKLYELNSSFVATTYRPDVISMSRMYIWLLDAPSMRRIVSPKDLQAAFGEAPSFSLDSRAHRELLSLLESHPAVRRISLPADLKPGASAATPATLPLHKFSTPLKGAKYPVVGVIDGGMDPSLKPWIVHASNYVAPHHADISHGSEIGALLVDGQLLNGRDVCPEPDGCWLADLALLPQDHMFSMYHRSELHLVDLIEQEVVDAKAATGARVFCFSHNLDEPPGGTPIYTDLSHGLDWIARKHDVLFVVSAGNAPHVSSKRREWTANKISVLTNLASSQSDRVTAPADSVLSIAVGAINPPNVAGTVAGAPARYSRRGPGLMKLVKPDVAHFGGVCDSSSPAMSGLLSATIGGQQKFVHGTSYSAPLVAKALARYDQVTLNTLPREALTALLIHGAQVPQCLATYDRSSIVRDMVGFGVPVNAQDLINGSPHSSTLLFYDDMMPSKDLFFAFDWPRSLVTDGKCRGKATLTLVYTPPISDAFETEMVRINLEAVLQRRNPKTGTYDKDCEDTFSSDGGTSAGAMEKELIEDGLKWGVVKQTQFYSKRGKGSSSDWRIWVKYLERSGESFPLEGVPFAMLLTISDIQQQEPIYQDMRIGLSARDVLTGDIRQPGGRLRTFGGRSGR
ncbi:S8 family peptidase [Piscinibacter sp. HJYY11]|uniref:S8 family peptidase n=1 Tax=Piscinibacter sp. HJYY11 TaxID=2801333 RepID=UPI00191CB164|nr:S8 family peptidase [Piscinibacter sp. HJYY11]MBL0729672.1 S8 family peptidase [Piscinibacter sp. HJYY11]